MQRDAFQLRYGKFMHTYTRTYHVSTSLSMIADSDKCTLRSLVATAAHFSNSCQSAKTEVTNTERRSLWKCCHEPKVVSISRQVKEVIPFLVPSSWEDNLWKRFPQLLGRSWKILEDLGSQECADSLTVEPLGCPDFGGLTLDTTTSEEGSDPKVRSPKKKWILLLEVRVPYC